MDRDLWLSSSTRALGAVLATQANVDDVLRAAAATPPAKRRARARAERRLRKVSAAERANQATVDSMAAVGRGETHHG